MAGLPISPLALEYAVQSASPAERRAFADVLGSGWKERHGVDGFHAAGLAEAVELMGGGRNRRLNSNERRIRSAGLALMGRYPMRDPFAPDLGYTPAPNQTATGAPLPPSPAGGNRGTLIDQLGGPAGAALGLVVLYLLARGR